MTRPLNDGENKEHKDNTNSYKVILIIVMSAFCIVLSICICLSSVMFWHFTVPAHLF
jgi:hypothetical protein